MNFEQFARRQFPFRPDHPDFTRLREVVDQIEEWKAQGRKPEEVYEELMDLYSVTYVAVNRSILDADASTRKGKASMMADSWMEGFVFGMLFQQLGGHQEGVNQ